MLFTYVSIDVCTSTTPHGNQRSLDPLDLASDALVSMSPSSGRAVRIPNHSVISLSPTLLFSPAASIPPDVPQMKTHPSSPYSYIQPFFLSYYNLLVFPFSQNLIQYV